MSTRFVEEDAAGAGSQHDHRLPLRRLASVPFHLQERRGLPPEALARMAGEERVQIGRSESDEEFVGSG